MSATTHGDSVGHDEQKTNPIRARRRHRYILMSGGALFLIALVGGFVPQFRQRQIATVDTKELAIPTVAGSIYLCAGQRIPQGLARRYWRACSKRPVARRDRHA